MALRDAFLTRFFPYGWEYPLPVVLDEDRGFAFVHVPKNAGTSIEVALTGRSDWEAVEKHLTVRELIERIGPARWGSLYTFAVVRNPWDRLVSQYEFSGAHWCRHHFGRELEFKEYVRRVVGAGLAFSKHDYACKLEQRVGDADWSQLARLRGLGDGVGVQFVARFENLAEEVRMISSAPGLASVKLGRENESALREPDFRRYDDETASIVAQTYKADIATFGYEFALG